jgi:DNA-binding HxlR family transcriptional regulator
VRSYRDLCGIARALDVVGERWALLVVRELLCGPKRFADLHRGLPGMSQNVLTQRLRELEESHVLARRRAMPPAAGLIYELTDHGRALEPVLLALGRWGSPLPPQPDSAHELSPDALIVALRTTFDAAALGSLRGTVSLRLPGDAFLLTVSQGELDAIRAHAPADAALHRAHCAGPRVRPPRAQRRHPGRRRERRG